MQLIVSNVPPAIRRSNRTPAPLPGARPTPTHPPQHNVRVFDVHLLAVVGHVAEHVVKVIHYAIDERHKSKDHYSGHVLLHGPDSIPFRCPQTDERGQRGHAPHVLPPERHRHMQLLYFQHKDIQSMGIGEPPPSQQNMIIGKFLNCILTCPGYRPTI